MAAITLKGSPVNTSGNMISIGMMAPAFTLTNTELNNIDNLSFIGKKTILNIFPSVDTSVCAASVRRFNKELSELNNTVVLCISADLPFAQSRFCGAEGLKNVVMLSSFRNCQFGDNYGVNMIDGPLAGLLARAIIILNTDGMVVYTELVPEITQEPDYAKALLAAKL